MIIILSSAFTASCQEVYDTLNNIKNGVIYTPSFEVSGQSVLIVNIENGMPLYEKNALSKAFPASTTKIMTCILVLELCDDLDEEVEVNSSALTKDLEGSSNAALKAGEVMTVRNLLYCAMVRSACDACNVLAEHISGSVSAFVGKMNEKARELGMTGTNFTNTHGLTNDNHYTTAYDMYLMTKYALDNVEEFMTFANETSIKIPATNKTSQARSYNTTNQLISRGAEYYYPPAKGIKTGWTTPAGSCLVSIAEDSGFKYLCVVFGAERTQTVQRAFEDSKNLYEWAFKQFKIEQLISETVKIKEVTVELSRSANFVIVYPNDEIRAFVPIDFDLEKDLELIVDVVESVDAPVKRGQVLGTVTLRSGNREFGTLDLVAQNAVERSDILYYMKQIKEFVNSSLFKFILISIAVVFILCLIMLIIHRRRKKRARRRLRMRNRF